MHSSFQRLHTFVIRILSYPTSSFEDDLIEGRIRAEQVNSVKWYLPSVLLANICNASVLVAALWDSSQRQWAIWWGSTILVFCLYSAFRHRLSNSIKPSYISHRAITRTVRNALLLGCLWATLPLIFFADASPGGQIIIACLCAGMLGGGAFALSSIPAAALAFTAPIVIASAISIGRTGDTAYFLVVILMVSYIAVLWRGVYVHASQVGKRVADHVNAERKVRCDELTGLPNRLAFFEALESAFARLERLGERFAILYLDLNDFKTVNDRWGHATGDRLLVQVGQRLRGGLREAGLLARLSGDEFAIVVGNIREAATASTIATRLVSSLDSPFGIDNTEVITSACIGIAFAPADGTNPEALLKSADEALYDAKHQSGGVIQLFDPSQKHATRQRRALERDLRDALRRDEFCMVYQPFFELETNQITGCEALIRWKHPAFGLRPPSEFMEAAEDTGLINEIGNWVFLEACNAARAWPKNMRVAVNVSAVQLRHPNIAESVVNALTLSALPPERLEIEITETAVIANIEQSISNLKALRTIGVRIALDDFGTGYSSLTYLRKLSPDTIKIDGSFVRELAADADCRSIIKSLIKLSRELRIKIVAECIETAGQLHFLRKYHCNEGQGNFLCAPKSIKELEAHLVHDQLTNVSAA